MAYTNSKMVVYKKLSPNHSGQRTHSIDRISPHCVVGQVTAESLGSIFAKSSYKASSNYGNVRGGEEPFLVYVLKCQRPEGCDDRVCIRHEESVPDE